MGNCIGVSSAENIAGRPPPANGDEELIRLDAYSVTAREVQRSSLEQKQRRLIHQQQKQQAIIKNNEINQQNNTQQSFRLNQTQ